tara:strand:+ start:623 stop:820 length:198 start_codon:yes stop_codon:yes gene_type:complete
MHKQYVKNLKRVSLILRSLIAALFAIRVLMNYATKHSQIEKYGVLTITTLQISSEVTYALGVTLQ